MQKSRFYLPIVRRLGTSRFTQPLLIPRHWQVNLFAWSMALAIVGGLQVQRVSADSPDTAPAALKNVLAQIDTAANNRNLREVLGFYSPNFTHSDGLTPKMMEQSLSQLWQRYANLKYQTELVSWKAEGNGIVAETVTRLTGTQKVGDRTFTLTSELRAQQRFEGQKIVQQRVLGERSKITSGDKPPTVLLTLPDQVKAGQEFAFDAIVQEPLGEDLLLGAALEEPIKPSGYMNPTAVSLEPLSAGGIFKLGRAPTQPDNRWISAVIVRHDGMTMITQRLQVVDRNQPAKTTN
ncbi:nuclear transport factor 2 family protein [Pantanalinema rosaneae CENA516]|uniref:nuclear transport factor 2 family protein n=1 Tax=Pantanalinema rosaneae TaxID=1620701 RepID=UPI003D6FEECE